ncbi:hypothetical protein [Flavobacterium reichenbachii]|uniref:Uncharacterized protein n=1 Tax=Flavobacterium reichenbachii TaxID=362418 RepID=A0A085ZJW4_9FLAO|nr:hypothetical protein [Flavobacterium reichenbachii]KFF04728.1 hypothetical protein IW19_03910 [Flavobacterium reichenbachii]OXB10369.1 hypothetical protein B0A68_22540 [Flavobacterium reichenbachii]
MFFLEIELTNSLIKKTVLNSKNGIVCNAVLNTDLNGVTQTSKSESKVFLAQLLGKTNYRKFYAKRNNLFDGRNIDRVNTDSRPV